MISILVVDDEPLIRILLLRMLEPLASEALGAGTAAEADALLKGKAGAVSLAVVDVSLPDSSGAALAAKWIIEYPAMKVILISGYPVASSTLVPGRIFFLQKPFIRETLFEAVAAAGF